MNSVNQEPEPSKERYISLVSPNSQLTMDDKKFEAGDGFFEAPTQLIPQIGKVHLVGTLGSDYRDQTGITIQNGKIVKKTAMDLIDEGLYPMVIEIDGFPKPSHQIWCTVLLPTDEEEQTILKAEFSFYNDSDEEPWAATLDWQQENNDEVFPILIPPDPEFLSTLKFSFT